MTDKQSLIGLKPLRDRVLVYIYDDGDHTIDLGNGKKLVMLNDSNLESVHDVTEGSHPGIRARWALVVGVSDETPSDIKVGDKVYLEQLKWRRGIMATNNGQRVWDISFHDILVVDDAGLEDDELKKVAEYLEGFGENLAVSV